MPRIGFAYNQKPESPTTHRPDDDAVRGDDEPPSSRRDAIASRNSNEPASTEIAHSVTVGESFATPAHSAGTNGTRPHSSASNGHHPNGAASNGHRPSDASLNGAQSNTAADDEFAEWDSVETIDAVANALSALGDVIRLEANADFPQNLRDSRVDIVFNIAEGLHGVNREAHVPAICEFYGIPYSASDPFTLSLCLDKAKTKEVLAYHDVPTAASRSCADLGLGNRELGIERLTRFPLPSSRSPLPSFC